MARHWVMTMYGAGAIGTSHIHIYKAFSFFPFTSMPDR